MKAVTENRERGQDAGKSASLPQSGMLKVYRGTPDPEDEPHPRAFAAVFFSADRGTAAQYGGHLHEYEIDMSRQKILDLDGTDALPLVREFYGPEEGGKPLEDEEYEDVAAELFMFPDKAWTKFLKAKGYTGISIGTDLALFDLSGINETGSTHVAANYEERLKEPSDGPE